MYSLDDLIHVLHSDGAEQLKLAVGQPPILVIDGEDQALEGPLLTAEDTQQLLQCATDTRQRRELREYGAIEVVYQFRQCASFVVRARVQNDQVSLDIH